MEKAKDGVTLIADAIRREMAEEQARAKQTQTETDTRNVIEVTAQFSSQPPVKAETKPPETAPDVSNKTDISNDGNKDDGTIYKSE